MPGLDAPVYGPIKITKQAHEMSGSKGVTLKENIRKKVSIQQGETIVYAYADDDLQPPHSVTSALFMPNHEDRIITSGSHDG